jgi:hypothetical protein
LRIERFRSARDSPAYPHRRIRTDAASIEISLKEFIIIATREYLRREEEG